MYAVDHEKFKDDEKNPFYVQQEDPEDVRQEWEMRRPFIRSLHEAAMQWLGPRGGKQVLVGLEVEQISSSG